LIQTADWRCYSALVERRYSEVAEGLLKCKDYAEYRFIVGALGALQEAYGLPDLVIAKWEEIRDHTRRSASRDTSAERESAAHTFSSRWWKPGPGGVESADFRPGMGTGQEPR